MSVIFFYYQRCCFKICNFNALYYSCFYSFGFVKKIFFNKSDDNGIPSTGAGSTEIEFSESHHNNQGNTTNLIFYLKTKCTKITKLYKPKPIIFALIIY